MSEVQDVASGEKKRRQQKKRNFPASAFEDALDFSKEILSFGAGQSVRRLSLFDHLKKSPESGASRMLITNASKYGLIKGSYTSEVLELTPDGRRASDEQSPDSERSKIRAKLAIFDVEPFNGLYERFKGNKLPAKAAMIDAVKDFGVDPAAAEEAVDTFIVNLRFVNLLQTLSGAERIVPVEHLLEVRPQRTVDDFRRDPEQKPSSPRIITSIQAEFEKTAFYVAPIGSDNSEQRKHSDLFLGSFVEPALEQFQLKVVRADAIDKPGIITKQIIEFLLRARLVIADLSFHNPNVFYELAIRHMIRKPVVQVMRASDRVPFDISQVRTILIDNSDIYSLVPRIETYRSEIANQVRKALDDPDAVDNPISFYFPTVHVSQE